MKLLVIAVTLTLTACGGGSGSSTQPTTPPVVVTPGITPAHLQTTVPAPTYAAGSTELTSFVELNGFRRMMGLGLVAQKIQMDVAAINHASYIAVNKIMTHTEDPLKAGFTGVNPSDRLIFAKYTGNYAGEVVGSGVGKQGVDALMNTIYHRDGISFQPTTEVGIAYNGGWGLPLEMDFGRAGLGQNNASDFSTTYPVANQTDLPLTMYPESPNPFSAFAITYDLYATSTSSPISVYSEANTTLTVSSFSVTENGQSMPLDVYLVTMSKDVNALVYKNVAHIVGKAPFKANTKYNVSFIGNVNGVPLVKNWSFTTGTSVNIGGGANQ